ncbi:MAG: hypothetical protein Q7J47_00025 [Azoarcus sp.]|nr:hypothetical protein [Azoarcus sp.]
MKISPLKLVAGSFVVLAFAELVPLPVTGAPIGVISEAQAIVGAPLTPISVAGVARRTTRRVVVAGSASAASTSAAASATSAAASASSAATSAATAQAAAGQAPAATQLPAPPPGTKPPIGTVVGTLPAGCVSAPVSGIEYYLCNGSYYRATFQGNNLVYVVQQP